MDAPAREFRLPAKTPAATQSGDLSAPLYVAWQITNECNLACLHCIEESGPGKAFPDELSREQVFAILQQILDAEVPYLSFSGGEPMGHPHFFEMAEFVCGRGGHLKIETNGHMLDRDSSRRLAEIGVKAVQISLDGANARSFNRMRVRGDFTKVLAGLGHLRDAGVVIEVNFSPAGFNIDELDAVIDLAFEFGARSFYTGRTMYTGNAVKAWRHLAASEDQYARMFETLRAKAEEYRGRMRVHFHEMGLIEELRYRLDHPAALLIILPNGLVKLINALPFVCGDLRRNSLDEVWAHFQDAWRDPRVGAFIHDLVQSPGRTAELHRWIHL